MLSTPAQEQKKAVPLTQADLDLLEAQIQAEEKKLAVVKESLDRAAWLTQRLVATLDGFDERIGELDPVIMPIFRSLQGISVINTNVEGTLGLLKRIEGYNELAALEEDHIIRGPTVENVSEYLGAINRVTDGVAEMRKASLDFCSNTTTRLGNVAQTGVAKIIGAFTEWLGAASVPPDPQRAAEGPLPSAAATLSEEQCTALKLIAGFAAAADDQRAFAEMMGAYCSARGSFLKRSLEEALEEAKEAVVAERRGTGSYQRASHPFVRLVRLVARLLREEDMFAHAVLPGMLVEETLRKTVAGVADDVFVVTQSLAGGVLKACERHEYSDQVYVFDLLEAFSDAYYGAPASSASLRSALQLLTQSCATLLTRFRTDIETEARQPSPSLPTPATATVFEMTSSVLNCLKRLLEYERVLEVLLRKTDPGITDRWDGLLGPLEAGGPPEPVAMPAYYQACLKALELVLEQRAKAYRKPASALVFRLNNYRHINRLITTTSLATMLTPEAESRYQSILQQLRDQYLASWKALACILLPAAFPEVIPMLPPSTAAKERLKVFLAELDEALKLQGAMAMPDGELRVQLKDQVRDVLLPVFQRFFQDNQTVFMALAAKGTKYDADTLSDQLASLFSA